MERAEPPTQIPPEPPARRRILACRYGIPVSMPSYHRAGKDKKYLCTRPGSDEAIISCPFPIEEDGPPADCPQNS